MLLVVLLLLCFLIVYLSCLRRKSRFWQCLKQMPQPAPYFLIGNIFEIMKTPENMFLADRKRNLKYYPIYFLDLPTAPNVNIINPHDMEIVMSDIKQIDKSKIYNLLHAWLGTGLLTSGGTKWQNRRKILTPAFHFNILQDFLNVFIEETDNLVLELEKDICKSLDVVPAITHFALMSIGETAMGINLDKFKMHETSYKEATYEIGRMVTHRAPRPWTFSDFIFSLTSKGRCFSRVVKILHQFSKSVIDERKKSFSSVSYSSKKRLAMLDLLLKYQKDGANIDDEGIREEVDTFMFEGHDTTAVSICYTLMLLANHREYQDEIYNEIVHILGEEKPTFHSLNELKFMDRFIKESLRLYPSVPFIARAAGSDITTTDGFIIPEGCMINLQIYDMHHNPNVFEDPEKFDPDRFLPENVRKRHPFAYIPFSAGSRNCIGQRYATMEIKTVLCGILKKFSLEPVDTPEDLKFVSDLVLRPKDGVRVKFIPRK